MHMTGKPLVNEKHHGTELNFPPNQVIYGGIVHYEPQEIISGVISSGRTTS